MKHFAIVFSLAITGLFLGGCTSAGGGADADGAPVGADYADPDNLETQQNIQELHSDVLRQNL